MKKRNAVLFLVLLLILSLFAACGKKDAPAQETPASSTESSAPQESKEEAPAQESASEEVTEEQSEEESTVETPEISEEEPEEESEVSETTPEPAASVEGGLSLTLVSSIANNGWRLQSQYEDGFYYRDGDLYGIMNMDGSSSTGSIFASVSKEGKLFVVTSDASEFVLETDSLNRYGVVDSEGRIIVPEEYAGFKDAGDRYITAIKVIEQTENEDEALMYFTSRMFSIAPDEDDVLYKGEWTVFDVVTGEQVSGATGTVAYWPSSKGNYLTYTLDDGTSYTVGPDGAALPENADLFTNGTYAVADETAGTVYDVDGTELFSYDPNAFTVRYSTDIGYYADITRENVWTYALLDENGNIASAEFDQLNDVCGPFILAYNRTEETRHIYDFEGNPLLDNAPIGYIGYYDPFGRYGIVAMDEGGYSFIDHTGELLLACDENADVYASNLSVSMDKDGDDYIYSFKDHDYTIPGYSAFPSIASSKNEDGTYDLIDLYTGQILLTGYDDYDINTNSEGVIWIIADSYEKQQWDVYTIESSL